MARKRHDPPSTPADGRRPWLEVENKSEERAYCWVNPNDEMTGRPMYEAMGWETEMQRADGPRTRMRSKSEGGEIGQGGMVLMSRPLSEHLEDWRSGQAKVDVFEQRIFKTGNYDDPMRGQGFSVAVDPKESAPFARRQTQEADHG